MRSPSIQSYQYRLKVGLGTISHRGPARRRSEPPGARPRSPRPGRGPSRLRAPTIPSQAERRPSPPAPGDADLPVVDPPVRRVAHAACHPDATRPPRRAPDPHVREGWVTPPRAPPAPPIRWAHPAHASPVDRRPRGGGDALLRRSRVPPSVGRTKGYLQDIRRWYIKLYAPTISAIRDASSWSSGCSVAASPRWRPTTPQGSSRPTGAGSSTTRRHRLRSPTRACPAMVGHALRLRERRGGTDDPGLARRGRRLPGRHVANPRPMPEVFRTMRREGPGVPFAYGRRARDHPSLRIRSG